MKPLIQTQESPRNRELFVLENRPENRRSDINHLFANGGLQDLPLCRQLRQVHLLPGGIGLLMDGRIHYYLLVHNYSPLVIYVFWDTRPMY